MHNTLYRDFNTYLRSLFGERVQKITLDAGLSCPNRDGSVSTGGCVYCNARGSGTGAGNTGDSIAAQIERGKRRLAKRYKAARFLAYFQSYSNTYAPLPVLRELYRQALADPDVVGLSIGTRPDCVPDPVLDHLRDVARHRLVWMEYGLQSANDRTLQVINRGHDARCFRDAVTRTRARGLPVCAHVILGLPGETAADALRTARFLADLGIDGVKIHLQYVVRGTMLQQWFEQGRYRCLERREYAEMVGDFLSLLPPRTIVQRITGDPHPDELIAPGWALEKRRNVRAVLESMRGRGLYQGKGYSRTASDEGPEPV
jgi:radical SAM protein (TIGR01212 family)